jgi:redox-sensitive bicupin YhaK (pirin superfamily)
MKGTHKQCTRITDVVMPGSKTPNIRPIYTVQKRIDPESIGSPRLTGTDMNDSVIAPGFLGQTSFQHYPAETFPTIHPVHWLTSHFAVGGWSPLRRLGGMLTAHMTRIAPHNGFTWHPHRGLEIYTWVLEGTLYHEDTTGGKGEIRPGELQRMFSGDWIEHQELNLGDEPVRVIQIWYAVDEEHRGLSPHYQQVGRDDLPLRRSEGVRTYSLIGGGSPMEQHMAGRLTATAINPRSSTAIEPPREGEDLFLYVTDGAGQAGQAGGDGSTIPLGQYDVIVARPDMKPVTLTAGAEAPLRYLSFYLPGFISEF